MSDTQPSPDPAMTIEEIVRTARESAENAAREFMAARQERQKLPPAEADPIRPKPVTPRSAIQLEKRVTSMRSIPFSPPPQPQPAISPFNGGPQSTTGLTGCVVVDVYQPSAGTIGYQTVFIYSGGSMTAIHETGSINLNDWTGDISDFPTPDAEWGTVLGTLLLCYDPFGSGDFDGGGAT